MHIEAASPPPPQYIVPDGRIPVFTYFAIRGLGEVPRLMFAEAGAAYKSIATLGTWDEHQKHECNWRGRSPNGLLPTVRARRSPEDVGGATS